MESGADEFTIACTGSREATVPYWSVVSAGIKPFSRGKQQRPVFTSEADGLRVVETDIWAISKGSLGVLKTMLHGNIFEYRSDQSAFLEDPILYRGEQLFLGVVSHEGEGIVFLRPKEMKSFISLGVSYRTKGEWVWQRS